MGKLVRDKITQIIAADGKKPITRILEQEKYLVELDKKLNEEIAGLGCVLHAVCEKSVRHV